MYKIELLKSGFEDKLGRKYSVSEILSHVNKLLEKDCFVGQLGHSSIDNIELDKVSHKWINVFVDENQSLIGEFITLKTPMGKILELSLNEGCKMRSSIRATGYVNEDFVVTDLKLISFDLVYDEEDNE